MFLLKVFLLLSTLQISATMHMLITGGRGSSESEGEETSEASEKSLQSAGYECQDNYSDFTSSFGPELLSQTLTFQLLHTVVLYYG